MRVNLERLQAKRGAAHAARELLRAEEREARRKVLVASAASRPAAVLTPIAAVVQARPKSPRLCNPHLLRMARSRPCLLRSPICNRDPDTTVACHGAGVALGKGAGYKLSDFWTVWGCSECNHYTDAYTGADADQKAAVFWRGHAEMVIAWQAIAAAEPNTKDGRAARWALDHLQRIQGEKQ